MNLKMKMILTFILTIIFTTGCSTINKDAIEDIKNMPTDTIVSVEGKVTEISKEEELTLIKLTNQNYRFLIEDYNVISEIENGKTVKIDYNGVALGSKDPIAVAITCEIKEPVEVIEDDEIPTGSNVQEDNYLNGFIEDFNKNRLKISVNNLRSQNSDLNESTELIALINKDTKIYKDSKLVSNDSLKLNAIIKSHDFEVESENTIILKKIVLMDLYNVTDTFLSFENGISSFLPKVEVIRDDSKNEKVNNLIYNKLEKLTDKSNIDYYYELKTLSEEMISLVIHGNVGGYSYSETLNINMRTMEEITIDNYEMMSKETLRDYMLRKNCFSEYFYFESGKINIILNNNSDSPEIYTLSKFDY